MSKKTKSPKSSDITAPNPNEAVEGIKETPPTQEKKAVRPAKPKVTKVAKPTVSETVAETPTVDHEVSEIEEDNTSQEILVADFKETSEIVERQAMDLTNPYSVLNEDYGYYRHAFDAAYSDPKEEGLYIRSKAAKDSLVMIAGSVRSQLEAYDGNPAPWFANPSNAPSAESGLWALLAQYAMSTTNYRYDCYRWLTNDPNGKWRAGIEMNNGKLRGVRGQPISMDKAKLSIRNATNVVNSALNLGAERELFLPHSGFSVTVRPATLSEFIECERKIGGDTLELLRNSRGLLLSAESAYVYSAVMDLFLSTVISSDVGDISPQFLKDNILQPDVQLIAWLMACSKYPNGYILTMPCFANPGKCNYVTHETIDLKKMYRVNNMKLTQKQLDLASKVAGQRTLEEIDAYTSEFDFGDFNLVELDSYNTELKVKVRLGLPSVSQHQAGALLYQNILVRAADQAFATPLVGEAREKFIKAQFESMRAMLYEAWVMGLIVENDDGDRVEINETEEIRNLLIQISSDPYLLSKFLVGVEKFINRATIAVVGIPNVACPACGGFHETKEESGVGHHVIPLDVMSFFTTLCQQQITRSPAVAEALSNKNTMTTMNDGDSTETTTAT